MTRHRQQPDLPGRGRSTQSQRVDHRLQIQAQSIEAVFQRHALAAQVAGGHMEPELTRYIVQGQLPAGRQTLQELEQDLADSLNVRRVQIARHNGALYVDVEQGRAPAVSLLDMLQRIAPLPACVAALGWTEEERPLLFSLAGEDSTHVLVAGGRGAGKTSLLRTIALSLALHNRQSQVQMLFIDPDIPGSDAAGTGLHAMQYLPHVLTSLVTQPEDAAEVLAFLEQEQEHRARHHLRQPRIVLFIDRLASLLQEDEGAIHEALHTLLLRGPASGIHLVVSTRQPEAGLLRRSLPQQAVLRVAGRVGSAREAQVALRLPESGAEQLLGRGDFLARKGDVTVRFQAAHVDEYDLHLCLDRLHRRRPPALVARPLDPRTRLAQAQSSADAETFFFDGSQITWAGAEDQGADDRPA